MARDSKSFLRMLMVFVFSLFIAAVTLFLIVVAGGGNLISFTVDPSNLLSMIMVVLQMSVLVGLIGYLVSAVYEKSIVYTLIVAFIVAVLLAFMLPMDDATWILRALILLASQVFFVGGIVAGDLLGRPRLWLRALLGAAGGLTVGILISGISGLLSAESGGFIKGISYNLVFILHLGIVPPLALYLVRITFGKKNKQVEEETDEKSK